MNFDTGHYTSPATYELMPGDELIVSVTNACTAHLMLEGTNKPPVPRVEKAIARRDAKIKELRTQIADLKDFIERCGF